VPKLIYHSYMQGYADQKALLDNGIDREMLTEIFKGLTNLETVDVRDFCAKRERDGTFWASWGATTVLKETGVRLRESYRGTGSQSRFVSHVFSNLLYAMGVAGRTPPRFEVLFRQQPSGLPDGAFHLANFAFPAVQPVLHNLRTLFLTLNLADASAQLYHTYSGGTPARAISGQCLRHFLHCTPNLTHLRLNFQKFQVPDNMEFMKWLATSPTSPPRPPHPTRITMEQPPPVSFPHLRALEFGQLDVDRDILLAVLQRFASKLKHLSLWRVSIQTGPPGPYNQNPNIWAQFFRGLASVPDLELTYLKAGALTQDGHNAHFKNEADSQEKSALQREYSGKDMKVFITGLADDVVVNWPPPLPSMSDESSSDEDEDISDDDDDEDTDDEDGEDEE